MNRSKSLVIAAILEAVLGILGLASATRILAAGSPGLPPPPGAPAGTDGPPFVAGLLFMVISVASLFAAYGLWKNQKWGKVVAIITSAINGIFGLGDMVGAATVPSLPLLAAFGLGVAACIAVIVLVLRRDPQSARASEGARA